MPCHTLLLRRTAHAAPPIATTPAAAIITATITISLVLPGSSSPEFLGRTGVGEGCASVAGVGEGCPGAMGVGEGCPGAMGVGEGCPGAMGVGEGCPSVVGVDEGCAGGVDVGEGCAGAVGVWVGAGDGVTGGAGGGPAAEPVKSTLTLVPLCQMPVCSTRTPPTSN